MCIHCVQPKELPDSVQLQSVGDQGGLLRAPQPWCEECSCGRMVSMLAAVARCQCGCAFAVVGGSELDRMPAGATVEQELRHLRVAHGQHPGGSDAVHHQAIDAGRRARIVSRRAAESRDGRPPCNQLLAVVVYDPNSDGSTGMGTAGPHWYGYRHIMARLVSGTACAYEAYRPQERNGCPHSVCTACAGVG